MWFDIKTLSTGGLVSCLNGAGDNNSLEVKDDGLIKLFRIQTSTSDHLWAHRSQGSGEIHQATLGSTKATWSSGSDDCV